MNGVTALSRVKSQLFIAETFTKTYSKRHLDKLVSKTIKLPYSSRVKSQLFIA